MKDRAYDKGLAALREVVQKDPQVIDACLMMGNEYSRRHDLPKALDSYKHALALKPEPLAHLRARYQETH